MTSSDYHRKTVRLDRVYRVNLAAYCIAFAAVLVGVGVGVTGFVEVGVQLAALGAVLIMLLCLESYVILPFVKCPRCGNSFFRRAGLLANRVPLLNRSCLHCGLSVGTKHERVDS